MSATGPQIVEAPTPPQQEIVGTGALARSIMFRRRAARAGETRPGLVWLGGFRSDMTSTKAQSLDEWAGRQGRAMLRFDYSGHGASGGDFAAASIGEWLEESLALIRTQTEGPQILVGSSMGGWIALLVARALAASGEAGRIAGMVLIAPATDFTEALLWPRLPEEARAAIIEKGVWFAPSAWSAEPWPFTRKLIEGGREHLLLGDIIRTHCPVHILQGMQDNDVPWAHALKLVECLASDPVVVTMVRDGDHRLSRDQDIERLIAAVAAIA